MMDWEAKRARLERMEDNLRHTYPVGVATSELADDIRAALERVEELEANAALLDQAATDYRRSREAAEAKLARVMTLHEALLNTLAPSKSTWIQHVWRNAKAALAAAKGE